MVETRPLTATPSLLSVVESLAQAGHRAFAVGGAVRDRLLSEEGGDWDVSTDADPEAVLALFPRSFPIGLEHGTVGVRTEGGIVEVTTFRTDVVTDGRHAQVRFGASLEEDLARRDFTINAIAWDPLGDELIDPHGGMEDLSAGCLRSVGDPDRRFPEDYLRVLRAFRFAARFDLTYDPETWAALERHASRVTDLSGERVRDELLKTLAECRQSSRALEDWHRSGVMGRLLPEVAVCFGVQQNRHHSDDVGRHTLQVVDQVHPRRPFLRVVALFHDVGKPIARIRHETTGDWTFPEHEVVGARLTAQALRRLRFSNRETRRAEHLVRIHMDLLPPAASDAAVRRWIRRIGEENVWDLYRIHLADWWGNRVHAKRHPEPLTRFYSRVRDALAAEHALRIPDLAVGGDDLIEMGIEPGPEIGRVLERLLERVVEDPTMNRRDRLLTIARDEKPAGSDVPRPPKAES